jgi:hypothetical protein
MPQVHFLGEIKSCSVDISTVSISWAVVPGNFSWFLKQGLNFGESHTHVIPTTYDIPNNKGNILNYPLDLEYETQSTEGWPFFVCEVWDRKYTGYRSFVGCGSVWLPTSGANTDIEVFLWRPTSSGYERLLDLMVPNLPDLVALREMVICPYTRSEVSTASVGTLHLNMSVVSSGFTVNGVLL